MNDNPFDLVSIPAVFSILLIYASYRCRPVKEIANLLQTKCTENLNAKNKECFCLLNTLFTQGIQIKWLFQLGNWWTLKSIFSATGDFFGLSKSKLSTYVGEKLEVRTYIICSILSRTIPTKSRPSTRKKNCLRVRAEIYIIIYKSFFSGHEGRNFDSETTNNCFMKWNGFLNIFTRKIKLWNIYSHYPSTYYI